MSTEAAPRAGLAEWIGLVTLACPALLIGLDFTVLHLVLPQLAAELQPSSVGVPVSPAESKVTVTASATEVNAGDEVTAESWQTGHYFVGVPAPDPFIASARARVDVVVWQPAEFSDFTAARDESGAWPPWRTRTGTAPGTRSRPRCQNAGRGHWRAFYAGQPNWFRPATTAAVSGSG